MAARFAGCPRNAEPCGLQGDKENGVTFSDSEFEILKHRLDVPDCIIESITSDDDYTDDEVSTAISIVEFSRCVDDHCEIQVAVLIDCIEGSTYFSDCEEWIKSGLTTRQEIKAKKAIARRIEGKVMLLGISPKFPI